jgi:hypothetical protein
MKHLPPLPIEETIEIIEHKPVLGYFTAFVTGAVAAIGMEKLIERVNRDTHGEKNGIER